MHRLVFGLTRHALLFLVYGALGVLLVLVGGAVALSLARTPDLKPWHEASLDAEYTRADAGEVADLTAYRQLEDRLFAQLQDEVYARVTSRDQRALNRYARGSLADPTAYAEDGNRSYEWSVPAPRAAVLMVHGLSDSPYSLRPLARRLHTRGCHVMGLRLPGHGAAPAALKTIEWEDWAGALRMAVADLRRRAGPGVPLYIVGYSTGAALAVEYALARMAGEALEPVAGLVLLSPAIGVAPSAALAVWQARLAGLPGLGKLAWVDVAPEYDPYKYNSFAVNAGQQIYELTRVIDAHMTRLTQAGPLAGFPRTLVMQSAVDATVSPVAVVTVLMDRLADDGHEAVVFDVNRSAEVELLLRDDIRDPVAGLLGERSWPFDVTVLTNAAADSSELIALHRQAGQAGVVREPTGMAWPPDVFSLSHVALPMAPDDPIYGARRLRRAPTIYLGRIELLGEQGLLAVPPGALLRLRFNPFFGYLEQRTLRFMGLADARMAGAG